MIIIHDYQNCFRLLVIFQLFIWFAIVNWYIISVLNNISMLLLSEYILLFKKLKETNFLKRKLNKNLVCFYLENNSINISNLCLRHYEYKMYTALYITRRHAFLVFVFPVLCMLKLCVRSVAAVHLPTVLRFNITVLKKRNML